MAARMNFNAFDGAGMTSARTRSRMIDRIRQLGVDDPRVLTVMGQVPRHVFIDEALSHKAYDDTALPIGYGQTISQPYIVARMTELALGAAQHEKVLEIGTGCGYQAAVLSQLFKTVYSIERIAQLSKGARDRLSQLGLRNVRVRHGDGSHGMPEAAPFDVILIAAAAPIVPEDLIDQLSIGGRLIFPVGSDDQELRLIERSEEGVTETRLEKVRFVPLLPGLA
ncbi:protein-L-isoaspartate(D-aspartate) O-methyltransferase [Jeongeupia chitinilytica]|uniref:Protein-L-isoaspartate O-methyltransferase n=2 Tax=Jeongeupia chitinilytica TaxID=1041641 RepID=A0ABQ3GZ31_9NEIS|nr:protein-L-isoaspartate(D-aspartate) O-methyltransferase [Jeongeupia chitinilytica]GHD60614.1 protein-L-isoaspartate O-methyltransferase [Jeongeupia chitinilytica]